MKKILFKILLILLFSPCLVKAATSLKASSQTPIVGQIIYIQLETNYGKDKLINEAHYAIKYDPTKFEYVDNSWPQGLANVTVGNPGTIYVDKYNDGTSWEYGAIFQMQVRVISTGKTQIDVEITGDAFFSTGNKISQTTTSITMNPVEADSYTKLSSLSVKGEQISPIFNQNTYYYTLTVEHDVTSVEIDAIPGNNKQTVTGTGKKELVYGENRVTVTARAQNGDIASYVIMITKKDNRTTNTNLKFLSVTGTNILYQPGQKEYSATVSKTVDSVFITARTEDENASIVGIGKKKLETGMNSFPITVTSSRGTTETYIVNIERSSLEIQNITKGTRLSYLKVGEKEYDVSNTNSERFLYTTTEPITEIDVVALTSSVSATYVVAGNKNLQVGPNTIMINVTEDTGDTRQYYIYLYKYPLSARETKDLSLNYDSETRDILYIGKTIDETNIVPKSFVNSFKRRDFNFYYAVEDENGLFYMIKVDKSISEADLDVKITREEKEDYTISCTLPPFQDITLYVGNDFEPYSQVKVYSYDNEGAYVKVTDGANLNGGYITFKTNGQTHYVITYKTLVAEKIDILALIDQYKMPVAFVAGIIFLLVIISKIKKKQKYRKENPTI